MNDVPADLRTRCPLITPAAALRLRAMQEHPHAPPWDYHCGNRVTADDLPDLQTFSAAVTQVPITDDARIPASVLQRLSGAIPRTAALRRRIAPGIDLERQWTTFPTTSRADLGSNPGAWLPDDVDWERLVCHETSGTTGHPLIIPHHPAACAAYEPLYAQALVGWGVHPRFQDDRAACILVCAQRKTIRYATVCALWDQGLHAKINLTANDWPTPDSAGRFLADHDSTLYTGDPDAFTALLRHRDIGLHPHGLLSTAMTLPTALAERLSATFGCPAIDVYSLNESGPLAYRCRHGDHHLLPPDVHVEILDAQGQPCADGQRGEITISGGRNPNLPLLRYRTGDWAALRRDRCVCGDPRVRLIGLEGRAPVPLYAIDGGLVATVDISRVLRRFHLLRHRLEQHADGQLTLTVLPLPGDDPPEAADLAATLGDLFGARPIRVILAAQDWGDSKAPAYVSGMPP